MSTSLSVVVPVYNQAAEIGRTLEALAVGASRSNFAIEVIVVDDGSSDSTGDVARQADIDLPVTVVSQANSGRFAARRAGLERATGEFVLLLDSRVTLAADSLRFVEEQVGQGPASAVWNAHVDIRVDGNAFAAFWDVITRRAFSAYFADPRTTSFGLDEFDRFPKGTTCFLAPLALMRDALAAYRSAYADERHANDDTPVIRWLAARVPINISPQFRCTYEPRRTARAFVRHAYHRGTVFVDGHGRPSSRFFPAVMAFYPLSLLWVAASRRSGAAALAPLALASAAGAGLAVQQGRPRHAGALAVVAPLYALAHGAGMWRGLALLAAGKLGRLRTARE
jgi:glycosyltransferase involved in cell wall biosynthesis